MRVASLNGNGAGFQAHQNSLRFSAQDAHKAEIEKIEVKLRELEAAYSAESGRYRINR